MKTLYLVRHAKSSWKDSSLSDLKRPLNKRGLRNAPEMGKRLLSAGITVDLIVSSPAKRALSTAQFLARATGYHSEHIVQDDRLYFESVSSMLAIIQKTKSTVNSLMLTGHNPDMTSLLNTLCGYQTDNMPTCTIATIQFDHDWKQAIANSGTLIEYDYPKRVSD